MGSSEITKHTQITIIPATVTLNIDLQHSLTDMTPTAANAWVEVESAKRDAVVIPAKQHTWRTLFVVIAIIALPLECLLSIPLSAVISSIGALAGVWGTIEIVRVIKRQKSM